MKRIAIIGAGQSGLQLGIGLLDAGYEVTLYSDRSADDIQHGHWMSSQCMFDSALETERDLGLNYWEEECPNVEGISFAVPNPVGGRVIDWAARLDNFAQSVDQRLKIPRWMAAFQKRSGNLEIEPAAITAWQLFFPGRCSGGAMSNSVMRTAYSRAALARLSASRLPRFLRVATCWGWQTQVCLTIRLPARGRPTRPAVASFTSKVS